MSGGQPTCRMTLGPGLTLAPELADDLIASGCVRVGREMVGYI